ncbi:MAG: hypothetical protein ACREDE_10500, partial [Thermoplasmata archaeon]
RPVLPEGLESPYLEERLAVAQATVAHLGREIGALWPRSVPIQQTVATLEAELACARREFDFLRARESAPAVSSGTPLLLLPSPQRGIPTSRGAIRRGPEGRRSRWGEQGTFAPPGTVAWFTARRYNRTIGRIKSRRRRLAGVTFTLAIAVSVLLLALTLYFRESSPPLWIALLPAIWLVSVPFFVFSFRGTQRVLRRNHLELDREP